MIIQIRGTSGSGKSTVMRSVMDALGPWLPHRVNGRRQPLYYSLVGGSVRVLGHYESPCGGCDTIGSARTVFDLCNTFSQRSYDALLAEGLLLSEDVKWTKALSLSDDVRVLFLTTPVDRCIFQIKGRRAQVGKDKPLSEFKTRNRVATIERARLRLLDAGVSCRRCSSEQAPGIILKWLRLHAQLEV